MNQVKLLMVKSKIRMNGGTGSGLVEDHPDVKRIKLLLQSSDEGVQNR